MFIKALKTIIVSIFFVLFGLQASCHAPIFHFLFGEDAGIPLIKGLAAPDAEEQIERCSNLLLQKAIREFTAGNLFLFDGEAGVNQCHINALYITDLYHEFLTGNLDLSGPELTQEKKHLALSLFLSFCYSGRNSKLRPIALPVLFGETTPFFGSSFFSNNRLIALAKTKLANSLFNALRMNLTSILNPPYNQIFNDINLLVVNHPVESENSFFLTPHEQKLGLVCFPKFMGALVFLTHAQEKGIPFAIKARVTVGKETRLITRIFKPHDIEFTGTTPVIVIEGHAQASSFEGQVERFRALPTLEDLVLPCAADFMHVCQREYIDRFLGDYTYPNIKQAFDHYDTMRVTNGQCEENNTTFVIDHVYPDSFGHVQVCENIRCVDMTTEDLLASRRLS